MNGHTVLQKAVTKFNFEERKKRLFQPAVPFRNIFRIHWGTLSRTHGQIYIKKIVSTIGYK